MYQFEDDSYFEEMVTLNSDSANLIDQSNSSQATMYKTASESMFDFYNK